jgi:hypothetical protein
MSAIAEQPRSALIFRLSCWILGVVAFAQLICAGMGLAQRFESMRSAAVLAQNQKPVVVTVNPTPAVKPDVQPPVAQAEKTDLPPLPPAPKAEDVDPAYPALPVSAPKISDPAVGKLVQDASAARIAGDMASAITKLEEALSKSPKEPNTLYELGQVYEAMAAADPTLANKAADYYQEVFSLGITGAGSLYKQAAEKLRDGISLPTAPRGKLSLGQIRIFKDDAYTDGERVVVTVPVQGAPDLKIENLSDVEVQVHFFDSSTRDGIQVANDATSKHDYKWLSNNIDFSKGEGLMRATYIIPSQNEQQKQLFGKRSYYGQVVELRYKGELIDVQAWPRHLTGMLNTPNIGNQNLDPQFLDQELLPKDFDPGSPLLPTKPNELLPDQLPPR